MENIKQQIKEKRNVKENTINTYLRNLRVMAKDITGEDYKNLSFLNDFNKVKNYLEKQKASTKKNKLATIMVLLRLNEKKNDKLIDKYLDYLTDISNKYYASLAEHKKTERQSENWVSVKDLQKVFNKYSKEVREEGLNRASKKVLNKKEKELLQKFLVAGLYTLLPPRRNVYADVKPVSLGEFNKLKANERENGNYMVIQGRNKKFFSLGDYKTKKSMGTQKLNIPSKLNSVINIWLKYNDDKEHLLYNKRGDKMSRNGLTKFLMKVFNIKGKKHISSTMLRHIFITENIDLEEYKKMKAIANKMGHSVETQNTYNKKND
jgi:integrase